MPRGTYREVPPSDLRPNEWNPNAQSDFMFGKQQQSVQQLGFLDPILVRQTPTGLEIIDGEHRWQAATKLGETRVSVIDLGEVSDAEAKQLTIILNELRGKPEKTALAQLITELTEGDGGELAKAVLPYTEAEFDAFASMTDFDWSSLDTADQGREDDTPATDTTADETATKLAFSLTAEQRERVEEALEMTGAATPEEQLLALAESWLAKKPHS